MIYHIFYILDLPFEINFQIPYIDEKNDCLKFLSYFFMLTFDREYGRLFEQSG